MLKWTRSPRIFQSVLHLNAAKRRQRGFVSVQFNYDNCADIYDDYRTGFGPYLGALVDLARAAGARRALEIGCGTGNTARAFLKEYPCTLTGVDISGKMLAKAQAKRATNQWVQASAAHLPIASGRMDYIFGCYVLHHIEHLEGALAECYRVLGSGYAAFATASHNFIERYPMNAYFPSFAAIDKARFPRVDAIQRLYRRLGFRETGVVTCADAPRRIDAAYVDRIAAKFISTYALLPQAEFNAGLKRLYADLAPAGTLDTVIEREATVVWARK